MGTKTEAATANGTSSIKTNYELSTPTYPALIIHFQLKNDNIQHGEIIYQFHKMSSTIGGRFSLIRFSSFPLDHILRFNITKLLLNINTVWCDSCEFKLFLSRF